MYKFEKMLLTFEFVLLYSMDRKRKDFYESSFSNSEAVECRRHHFK